MTKDIQYLKRSEIDIVKWDACIEKNKGLIYGYSWWLDHMSGHWDALVLNDYEAIMPLTWRRKYGFHYLYQPAFTASLGLFAGQEQPVDTADFLEVIPSKFKLIDIDINETHPLQKAGAVAGLTVHKRLNLLLDLERSCSVLTGLYSRLAKRSLKKAHKHNIIIVRNDTPEDIITLYRKAYKAAHPGIAAKDYHSLIACCNTAGKKDHLKTYTAHTLQGETIAFYIVLYDNNFVYSLVGGSTAEGKSMGAFYLLTDAAIQDHAGTGRIFRFEGSDVPGIAFFNRQFGAAEAFYLHLKMNRLPFPVNILKQ
ncbi:hypothetical protein [Agriterribacter sp.]|uniref:GNAT family N-acetyltransferase n=1 Tax=Agriterribacter sp. TaxID=2821509 RepID=UPI002C408AFB|nr:hypothetical protein [Agriterribacter sp.]HRP55336.1 GNAT family N-acetyltransferase [Agriterribacter sp.]